MLRWVVVRHTPLEGPAHFDWLIDRDGSSALLTFRIADPEWGGPLVIGEFEAQRAADHRRRYLEYEGPLSDGRGSVRRVWAGEVQALEMQGDSMECRLVDGSDRAGGYVVVSGKRVGDERWRFVGRRAAAGECMESRGGLRR